jgi:hypothetical protein
MTDFFRAQLPSFLSSIIFAPLLILALAVSLLTVVGGYSVITFLMVSNPTSERHWRHMTKPMYLFCIGQMAVYVVALFSGATVKDMGCILAPLLLSVGCFVAVLSMRTDKAEDVEGGVRLGGDTYKAREV